MSHLWPQGMALEFVWTMTLKHTALKSTTDHWISMTQIIRNHYYIISFRRHLDYVKILGLSLCFKIGSISLLFPDKIINSSMSYGVGQRKIYSYHKQHYCYGNNSVYYHDCELWNLNILKPLIEHPCISGSALDLCMLCV